MVFYNSFPLFMRKMFWVTN